MSILKNTFVFSIIASLACIVLTGCVTTQTETKKIDYVFFPSPPELPRFQFLTSFQGSEDFSAEVSGLDSFLGGQGGAGYKLRKPYGVTLSKGAMYVVDTQSSVWKFDFVKKKIAKIQGDKGLGKLVQPINISHDQAGNKYVSDPVRGAVIKYDKNDFFVRAYNSPREWKPVAAAVYGDNLFVVDSTHHKGGINVFDIDSGEIIDTIGQSGPQEHRLQIPTNITFDADGYLFVMDAGRFQVVKYDRDGHYRGYLGGAGSSPGFFGRPRGIAVDREGRIYAVDAAFDIVQIFAENGQILAILGGPGVDPGTLTLPAGIYIDYENIDFFKEYAAPGFEVEYLVFVTSQFHNTNGITVYGYGKMAGADYPTNEEILEQLKEDFERKKSQ